MEIGPSTGRDGKVWQLARISLPAPSHYEPSHGRSCPDCLSHTRIKALDSCTGRVGPFCQTVSEVVRVSNALRSAGYILSGKRIMNPSRFGICTFGNVLASSVSFSPMSLFDARM
jgi:hypothetical protein